MLDPSPAPLSPNSAAIRAEAVAYVQDQLRQAEAAYGIACAVDIVIGMVGALRTWSEDVVGVSLTEVMAKRDRPTES